MSHCNNGLNNHLINNIIETKVAKETGDLKYLQDSMREFIAALSDLITGKYSDHFLEEYVSNLFVDYKSTLEESLKIPQLKEEVTLALQRLSAQDKTVRQHTDHLSQLFSDVIKLANIINLNTAQDFKEAIWLKEGDVVKTKGYYKAGDSGEATYIIESKNTYEKQEYQDHLVGTNLVARMVLGTYDFHGRQFGAKFDGEYDDTPHLQKALNIFERKDKSNFKLQSGSLELAGSPALYTPLNIPPESAGIRIFGKKLITIFVKHNGDGITYLRDKFQLHTGNHTLENLHLLGPNSTHPYNSAYKAPSKGVGIHFSYAYDNTLINVVVQCFHTGYRIAQAGFNNKTVGFCEFQYNEYGVHLVGSSININLFEGTKIRENNKRAVTIEWQGSGARPVNNRFINCYIESNTSRYLSSLEDKDILADDGSESVAVYLNATYENVFENCYFENQKYLVWINGSASRNIFRNNRIDGTLDVKNHQIHIADTAAYAIENIFEGNTYASLPNQVYSSHIYVGSQYSNIHLINNIGFHINTIRGYSDKVRIKGNLNFATNTSEHNFGALSVTAEGFMYLGAVEPKDLTNDNQNRYIQKKSDGWHVLHCKGHSQVILEDRVNTSILQIGEIKGTPNSFVRIENNGDRSYRFLKGTRVSKIVLKEEYGNIHLTLSSFGDSVLFFIDSKGKAIEVSRNISKIQLGTGHYFTAPNPI